MGGLVFGQRHGTADARLIEPLRESAREQALIKRLVARDKESYDDGQGSAGT